MLGAGAGLGGVGDDGGFEVFAELPPQAQMTAVRRRRMDGKRVEIGLDSRDELIGPPDFLPLREQKRTSV